MMDKLLRFLSGKKTIIASVLGLTSTYLASKGYIGPDETLLFGGIITLMLGGTSVLTTRMYNKVDKS